MDGMGLKQQFLRDAPAQRAHELRNSLGRLCVSLALARRSIDRDDLASVLAMLEEADQEAQRCRALVASSETAVGESFRYS